MLQRVKKNRKLCLINQRPNHDDIDFFFLSSHPYFLLCTITYVTIKWKSFSRWVGMRWKKFLIIIIIIIMMFNNKVLLASFWKISVDLNMWSLKWYFSVWFVISFFRWKGIDFIVIMRSWIDYGSGF